MSNKDKILKLAENVELLRTDALFELDIEPENPRAEQLFLLALCDLERATRQLKLAAIEES